MEKKYEIDFEEFNELCDGVFGGAKTIIDMENTANSENFKPGCLQKVGKHFGLSGGEKMGFMDNRWEWIRENVNIKGISYEGKSETDEILNKEPVRPKMRMMPNEKIPFLKLDRKELQRVYKNLAWTDANGKVKVTDDNYIYEDLPIKYADNFSIKPDGSFKIDEEMACLKQKGGNELIAFAELVKNEAANEYRLAISRENIPDYSCFEGKSEVEIVLFSPEAAALIRENEASAGIGEGLSDTEISRRNCFVYHIDCGIKYQKPKETENILCIDFGTSNTSAGSYGIKDKTKNNAELVTFVYEKNGEFIESPLYPTIVYTERINNENDIDYLYGYDALKKLVDLGYDTGKTGVFMEIKRWIGSHYETIEVCDGVDYVEKPRIEIIKEYISRIIILSEEYFKVKFKKIHMSAPVKIKEKFYNVMKDVIASLGYTLLPPEESIDEGIAIIYSRLTEMAEKNLISKDKDKPSKIIVMDCGGGTTDLASCEAYYASMRTATKLKVKTKFVNGNSNFGGNNITYRILQLLKIKLVKKFCGEKFDLFDYLPKDESEILNRIDEDSTHGKYNSDEQEIYRKFETEYLNAGKVVPTAFNSDTEFKFADDRQKIKRNYFYLWQWAEKVKLQFYEKSAVAVDLNKDEDKQIIIDNIKHYYIYQYENGELVKKDDPGSCITIDINEIKLLLLGDIYGLLHQLFDEHDPNNYDKVSLMGQSCKIPLFTELLKEFIPGKKLRRHTSSIAGIVENEGSKRLKLDCIYGCIAYNADKDVGDCDTEITPDNPTQIYDVFTRRGNGEVNLIRSNIEQNGDENYGYDVYALTASKAEFVVKSRDSEERAFFTVLKKDGGKKITLDDLFNDAKGKTILTEDECNTVKEKIQKEDPNDSDGSDTEFIVFALPSKAGYGMNVYQVKKTVNGDENVYELMDDFYENYEDESNKSFFDGRR